MEKQGMPLEWIEAMYILYERVLGGLALTMNKNETGIIRRNTGIKQDSPLSPTMFGIFFD